MAAVNLVSGSQNLSGLSSPVDVATLGQIRVGIVTTANHGMEPDLTVRFLTSATATGTFREIEMVQMRSGEPSGSPYFWDMARRVVLAEADNFLKVSWVLLYGRAGNAAAQTFNLTISGTGVLSA